MSNELISASTHDTSLAQADAVSKESEFFPRIQLCQSNAEYVKQKKIPGGGHFALIVDSENPEDLGEEFECIVVQGRAKALRLGEDEIIQNFDPNSEIFKSIMSESTVEDSGCMYGPEFLLWLPSHEMFVTYFLASKTGRRSAPEFKKQLLKAARVYSHLIAPKKAKFSWHGSKCDELTTPIEPIPSADEVDAARQKFVNEKATEVATPATSDDASARSR